MWTNKLPICLIQFELGYNIICNLKHPNDLIVQMKFSFYKIPCNRQGEEEGSLKDGDEGEDSCNIEERNFV